MIKSVLTYNCGTWGLTKAEWNKLDAFHRKQLKYILNITWPTRISNEKLYEITNEEPLSKTCRRSRWNLLGHILRRKNTIPANQAMIYYFEKHAKGFCGGKRATLPTNLHEDLIKAGIPSPFGQSSILTLSSGEDLEMLRIIASDRERWRDLTRKLLLCN